MPGCDAKGPKLIDSHGEKEARSGAGLPCGPSNLSQMAWNPSRALPLT